MALKSYDYNEDTYTVTSDMKKEFDEDGFLLIRGMFSPKEVSHIEHALIEGKFVENSVGIPDIDGRETHMVLWNHPGVDVTGMVSRCEKIVNTCEELLGGEVYHYHTKLMNKPPKIGGKVIWHQDYGYWYMNGCLYPNMMTAFIAVDKCTKENSCLQILKGSNKCGRIDHVRVGGQQGAEEERVNEISKICLLEYVEMEPGDVLFFHSTLIHRSGVNDSGERRWAFLCAFNRADNDPVKEHFHPNYTPLEKVPNSAILECQDFTTMDGKWFLNPNKEELTFKARKLESAE